MIKKIYLQKVVYSFLLVLAVLGIVDAQTINDNFEQTITHNYDYTENICSCNFYDSPENLKSFNDYIEAEIKKYGGRKNIHNNIQERRSSIAQKSVTCVDTKNHIMSISTPFTTVQTQEYKDALLEVAYVLMTGIHANNSDDSYEAENMPIITEIHFISDSDGPDFIPDLTMGQRAMLGNPNNADNNPYYLFLKPYFETYNIDMSAHWLPTTSGPLGTQVPQCNGFDILTSSFSVKTSVQNTEPSIEDARYDMMKMIHEYLHVLGLTHPSNNQMCGFPSTGTEGLLMSEGFSAEGLLERIEENNGSPLGDLGAERYIYVIEQKELVITNTANEYYVDNDFDGFGGDSTEELCDTSPPQGYSSLSGDCDDTNPNSNPNEIENPYNGIDDDCDPVTLDDDLDQDGFLLADDCDDNDPNINSDTEEIPNNGIDEDCDGSDLVSSTHEIANTTINIFPNPVTDVIKIDVEGQLNFKANLYDLKGKIIKTFNNPQNIYVDLIPSGTYLLELQDLNSTQKVVERIVIGK